MKVCMITSYPPERCGIADYAQNLVSALRKRGAVVTVVSRKKCGGEYPIISSKNVRRSFLQAPEELKGLGQTRKDLKNVLAAIKKAGPDVVHVQYEPGLYNLFLVPALLKQLRKLGIRTALTLHAIDYFPLTVFHRNFLYPLPDLIIVHTDRHKKIIRGSGRKVETIPMGIPQYKKVKMKTPDKKQNILFFGFLSPHKGLEDLIEAYKIVKRRATGATLTISSGINPAHAEEVAYKKRIGTMTAGMEGVTFDATYTPRRKLLERISSARVVVFPYRKSYSAGQSEAVLDAIALGKPVVVSDVPGVSSVVKDGVNGLVVPAGDVASLAAAIEKLLTDDGLRSAISKNNAALARGASWDAVANTTMNAYLGLKYFNDKIPRFLFL